MKTICDNCRQYEVSPSGTTEICHAFRESSTRFKNGITKDYIDLRMTAEKTHCKEFKKF